ncbi:helix-turn-helix transcriptional regulator [Plantactinospora endophytica]|uniref:Transcriptional regulator n=1 Tax=Plantactinospora endophytica TaxID=673535 RepID=A0ABQ4DUZ3_9ACTN|nr:helix-turn-helix transcriptional regulator [Plantactinospora endophytica]GIG86271.1 transcriptional regulator [Plantactinospora endophytica]
MSENGIGDTRRARGGNELGAALRHWRGRIDPATVGLPVGRIRRTTGLRREELALLAGISVDYVIRLEQGRATSPSGQVLTALARALRLAEAERRHLFLLANQSEPSADRVSAHLTPAVRRLLDQLAGTPVNVYDAAWTLIAWNALSAALLGDPSGLSGRERNVLWRHFTGPPARVVHDPEQQARFETAAITDLRAATVRYPADAGLRSLVADLRHLSPRFARCWESRAVGSHVMNTKTVRHPDVGPLVLDCDVLTAPGSDLHVVLYTAAPGTEAADKLRLLDVVGAQPNTVPDLPHTRPEPSRRALVRRGR